MPTRRRVLAVLLVLAAQFFPAGRALAQQPGPSWRPRMRLQGEVRYDNNPFLLDATRKQRLEAPSAADSVNGRFRDMQNATDIIPVASADVALGFPGAFGRPLEISADAAYEANVNNAHRRHAELSFALEQALPKAGRTRLRAEWRPSYFWRNYLSDAIDDNGDNNIEPSERIYRPGTSDELDLTLNVRRRLLKRIRGELEAGYFTRTYAAPFDGRDRRGPGAAAGMSLEIGKRSTAGVDYAFQSLQSDVAREVMILDETAFGVDFNGINGASDTAARAFELVDRSRVEHNVELSVQTELSDAVTLALGYARRMRVFGSSQPYDVADRDRRDTRNEFTAELTVRVRHGMRFTVSGAAARQNTNRGADPGASGEVADYSRSVVTAGLAYRF